MQEFWRSGSAPLELRRSTRNVECYRPHAHEQFSIGLIDAGSTIVRSRADSPIRLTAGDVILIPSGHIHSCNPDLSGWRYQMIHADQSWILGLLPKENRDLTSTISVFRDKGAYSAFNRVGELLTTDTPGEFLRSACQTALRLCEGLSATHRLTPDSHPDLVNRLHPVFERLRAAEENPSLDGLAALVSMDKFQLIRVFTQATGFTPMAWRRNDRVNQARRLLRDGTPIADTAHTLGFVDQSHLHRIFRAHVATSPGRYRN